MNPKALAHDIKGLKDEVSMLQSLTQLIHDSLKLSCVCEADAGLVVAQDVSNRLWEVGEKLQGIETQLTPEGEDAA